MNMGLTILKSVATGDQNGAPKIPFRYIKMIMSQNETFSMVEINLHCTFLT